MRGAAGDLRTPGRGKAVNGAVAAASGAGVLGALAGIAAVDARRMVIRLDLVALLMAAGMCWLFAGGGIGLLGTGWPMHLAGAALGAGIPLSLVLWAEALGRRWPIYPGDAMLLCAVGGILGLRCFLWATVLGSCAAVLHRICVQTRRGRSLTAGYLPAGPGLALGAAAVFVAVNAGVAFSAEDAGRARIAATELPPMNAPLPGELAGKAVALAVPTPLPFRDLVARIGGAAGVEVVIEERPSRIAGDRVALAEPEPLPPGAQRTLAGLLDDAGRRAGYAWEWKAGRVVFYRYWDSAWPRAADPAEVETAAAPDPLGRALAWLGRAFGGGGESLSGDGRGAVGQDRAGARDPVPEKASERAGERGGDAAEAAGAPTRDAVAAMAAEPGTKGAASGTESGPATVQTGTWEVDPVSQKTLRGVVESWAAKAGWKVDWRTRRDFSVGAAAAFEGGFLKAVDSLFSDPRLSRVLAVSAHANRYLVVREAGR